MLVKKQTTIFIKLNNIEFSDWVILDNSDDEN